MFVVSGEPRSGTSMMMQILKELGLKIEGEQWIHDWNDHLNPGGIYEVEGLVYKGLTQEIIDGKHGWITDKPMQGEVIKLSTIGLIKSEPAVVEKVIYCIRDPREVIVSQRSRMNNKGDKHNWEKYLQHMVQLAEQIEPEDLPNFLVVDYGDVIWSPATEVTRVAEFLDVEPTESAIALPNPEHYHSKKHKAKVNSVGRAAIRMYESFRGYI